MAVLAARRVLVAYDFSPWADEAGRAAARDLLCTAKGGTIILCHLFELMPLPEASIELPRSMDVLDLEQTVAFEVTTRLERAADGLRKEIQQMRRDGQDTAVIEVEVVVRKDTPAEGILAMAREQDTTRIVLGTHGRHGIAHFFLGSIAERVARAARVPVLVVKKATAGR